MASAVSGEELGVLAAEQAALRRVATLVARGVAPEQVFAAVTEEAGQLLSVGFAHLGRYESDGTMTILASSGRTVDLFPVGRRWSLGGKNTSTLVFETGGPARIESFSDASGPLGVAAREDGVGSSVGTPVIVEGRLWGVMAVGYSATGQPLPADTEARLANFTDLVATAIANAEGRAELARLAEEQAALRRVATLVARGVPPGELFAAVTEEVGLLLGTGLAGMARYGSDDTVTVVATWAAEADYGGAHPLVPGPWPLDGGDIASMIWRTGRPVRIEDYEGVPGPIAAFVRDELGVTSSVASPIVVESELWGVLFVHSKRTQPLPRDTESRLTGFTELVATAVANAEGRAGLARLAEEQAALRRVATLVARGVRPEALFAAVVDEVRQLLPVEFAMMVRFEPDGTGTTVANSSPIGDPFGVGARWPLGGKNVMTAVAQTGRPARLDSYTDASGPVGVAVRDWGVRSSVGAPVIVEGRPWGVVTVSSMREQPLTADTEARLASFTELLATAIANAESRAALAASRARIVAAADETRRRIERDLHDGIQQRLVVLGLQLRAAQAGVPLQPSELDDVLSRVADGLASVFDELREISHGIHPAILSKGGLKLALKALGRRSTVPVELHMPAARRLPDQVEAAAYYVVS
ncbi:MAG TPA: GAF domain-containing protein, partial [Jatrophihabitans sp.]|nr:GAF domain-containing protein [Jatrophihabitans sp.]